MENPHVVQLFLGALAYLQNLLIKALERPYSFPLKQWARIYTLVRLLKESRFLCFSASPSIKFQLKTDI